MGLAKSEMMEWEELGIVPSGASRKSVCPKCIEDICLQKFVRDNLDSLKCDYCGIEGDSEVATDVELLIKHIAGFVCQEWTDPVNELPYEGREDGYQGEVLNNYELMEAIGFSVENGQLFEDVCNSFTVHDWTRHNWPSASPSDRKKYGWRNFCHVVRHRRRFTFWMEHSDEPDEFDPDYLPPSLMLQELGESIKAASLIKDIPIGTEYWRMRVHKDTESLTQAGDLAPPPVEFANQPNRMSPAGVPMFYGALDWETCVEEIVDSDNMEGHALTGGTFRTLVELKVLDLTKIPSSPSFFSDASSEQRHTRSFLRYFSADLSKPVPRDQRQHIEYVPTQVFTEFVRYELARSLKHPIHGIIFNSSKNGHVCCVLFATKEQCLPASQYSSKPQLLDFVPSSLKTVNKASE